MKITIKHHKTNKVAQPITIKDRTHTVDGIITMSNLMRKHSYKVFQLK
jgi:hypothetical protein